ncbi:MAG: helix-turn-helix transcriptional regulator [Oscillospiraceae bacterium]|nr:helix-turn-helix transcriptional regulator [Oscillospiraceae bacterium]
MNTDFSRILTLLRKEKGISQKAAAAELNISQALLSHYEKGIRECGLDFVIRAADFYGVSCDYLLGRSPERTGMTLAVEDIPEEDENIKDNMYRGSVLPVLNKKLIVNSINILFDLLQRAKSKALTAEVSSFLMLSVYRMFRLVYNANPKNQQSLFQLPKVTANAHAAAQMTLNEANIEAMVSKENIKGVESLEENGNLYMTTDTITESYPQMASSLFNLIQNSENKLIKTGKER